MSLQEKVWTPAAFWTQNLRLTSVKRHSVTSQTNSSYAEEKMGSREIELKVPETEMKEPSKLDTGLDFRQKRIMDNWREIVRVEDRAKT